MAERIKSPSGVVHQLRPHDYGRTECGWWSAGWEATDEELTCQICINKASMPEVKSANEG